MGAGSLGHFGTKLTDKLGSNHGSHTIDSITLGIELHNITANNITLDILHNIHDITKREATRFDVGDARSVSRVKAIDIDGDVDALDTLTKLQALEVLAILVEGPHLVLLDTEFLGLVALLLRDGAEPHLDQAARVAALHDARERAGVRVMLALERVVDVWVRVDVENVHLPVQKL